MSLLLKWLMPWGTVGGEIRQMHTKSSEIIRQRSDRAVLSSLLGKQLSAWKRSRRVPHTHRTGWLAVRVAARRCACKASKLELRRARYKSHLGIRFRHFPHRDRAIPFTNLLLHRMLNLKAICRCRATNCKSTVIWPIISSGPEPKHQRNGAAIWSGSLRRPRNTKLVKHTLTWLSSGILTWSSRTNCVLVNDDHCEELLITEIADSRRTVVIRMCIPEINEINVKNWENPHLCNPNPDV
ncbi:hypothetical protein J6590_032961 [Homalodisca vitripennis]|nr:hypothetical protein J6590_032961 [Homalodisca vitripennis]